MLFKKRKLRNNKIEENKFKMRRLFSKEIDDSDTYNLILAYSTFFNPKIKDYTYNNLILGYKNDDTLVVMETNKELSDVYSIRVIDKNSFKKASYNLSQELFKIYFSNKECLKFTLIEKNYIDVDLLPLIEQEIEVDEFKDFFFEFRIKPHIHIKRK